MRHFCVSMEIMASVPTCWRHTRTSDPWGLGGRVYSLQSLYILTRSIYTFVGKNDPYFVLKGLWCWDMRPYYFEVLVKLDKLTSWVRSQVDLCYMEFHLPGNSSLYLTWEIWNKLKFLLSPFEIFYPMILVSIFNTHRNIFALGMFVIKAFFRIAK